MSEPIFHPFPRLPFEIRAAIFHLVLLPLPAPKIINVHIEIDPTGPFDRHEYDSRQRFPTRSKFARFFTPGKAVPSGLSLLWTSVESRTVAKSYYSFTCADIPSSAWSSNGAESMNVDRPVRVPKLKNPGILFNPHRDIIYLQYRHGIAALSYARSSELKLSNIKILALDLYLWKHYLIFRQLFEGWQEDAPFLIGLEKLIIVMDSDQSTMLSTDARSVGNATAIECLRVEVERKLAGLKRLKRGIKVLVVHRDELSMEKPFLLSSSI